MTQGSYLTTEIYSLGRLRFPSSSRKFGAMPNGRPPHVFLRVAEDALTPIQAENPVLRTFPTKPPGNHVQRIFLFSRRLPIFDGWKSRLVFCLNRFPHRDELLIAKDHAPLEMHRPTGFSDLMSLPVYCKYFRKKEIRYRPSVIDLTESAKRTGQRSRVRGVPLFRSPLAR